MERFTVGAALWVLGVTAATDIMAEPVFNRIASFPVPLNLPHDMDQATETSAEIMAYYQSFVEKREKVAQKETKNAQADISFWQ